MAAADPLAGQFPAIYAQWVAAGGVHDAFRANLLAIQGGLDPNSADIAWLVGHSANGLDQLRLALAKFGAQTGLVSQVVVISQPSP